MPGPFDAAAIDTAWTRMLAVGEAGGYLAAAAAPNVLNSLAAIDHPLAEEYFRRLLRVNEVAVILPEPMLDVTEMFCVDGAAGFAWLVALQHQLPKLRATTCGDVSVGLEVWVGRQPLLSSVPVPGDDWANERDARLMGRLAPVARAGHGAMRLPLRESTDRTFLLPSAPSDWDTVFAAPRLLPWFLPQVFTHRVYRLTTATRDPLLSVARLAAACAMVSTVLAAYERDRRLFRPPPFATWALTRFGPVTLAQVDNRRATTLRLILAAWPHVPWRLVRQRLPYSTPGKEPPTILYAQRGTMMSAERHWVGVTPCASSSTGLGCTEAALQADLPPQFPYVDIGGDGYSATHPAASAKPSGLDGSRRRGLLGRSPKGAVPAKEAAQTKGAAPTVRRTRVAPCRPAVVAVPTRAVADGTPLMPTRQQGGVLQSPPGAPGAATTRPAAARAGTATKGPAASAPAAVGNRAAAAAVVGRRVPGASPVRMPDGTRLPPTAAGGTRAQPATTPGTPGGRAGTAVLAARLPTGATTVGTSTVVAETAAVTTVATITAASTAATAAAAVVTAAVASTTAADTATTAGTTATAAGTEAVMTAGTTTAVAATASVTAAGTTTLAAATAAVTTAGTTITAVTTAGAARPASGTKGLAVTGPRVAGMMHPVTGMPVAAAVGTASGSRRRRRSSMAVIASAAAVGRARRHRRVGSPPPLGPPTRRRAAEGARRRQCPSVGRPRPLRSRRGRRHSGVPVLPLRPPCLRSYRPWGCRMRRCRPRLGEPWRWPPSAAMRRRRRRLRPGELWRWPSSGAMRPTRPRLGRGPRCRPGSPPRRRRRCCPCRPELRREPPPRGRP